MHPTLFYTFKGLTKGIKIFDVRKIFKMVYRQRLYCIFDREYKYELEIKYLEQKNELDFVPVITTGGFGFGLTNTYNVPTITHLRYKTEEDIIDELNQIEKYRDLISKYDERQMYKFHRFIEKIEKNEKN